MITGTGQINNGRKLILLGVERENINRLIGGRPIHVKPEQHSITEDLEILIFFGEGPEELKAVLDKAGLDAKRIEDRRDETRSSS